MILVTVGTTKFYRLIKKMDEIAGKIDENVIMQIGYTNYKPINAEYFDFINQSKMKELNQKARLVVCHGGVGAIITAVNQKTRVITIPRIKSLGEEVPDDHQLDTVKALEAENLIQVVYDLNNLERLVLQELQEKNWHNYENKGLLVSFLKNYLDSVNK